MSRGNFDDDVVVVDVIVVFVVDVVEVVDVVVVSLSWLFLFLLFISRGFCRQVLICIETKVWIFLLLFSEVVKSSRIRKEERLVSAGMEEKEGETENSLSFLFLLTNSLSSVGEQRGRRP